MLGSVAWRWGSAQQVLSFCRTAPPATEDGPAVGLTPSACPYLACPPGVWGRWAWTAAPDQLNSRPAPATRSSSLVAGQKSGGRGEGWQE